MFVLFLQIFLGLNALLTVVSSSLTVLHKIWLLQGDRTENVGVVDSEYVVHQGLPTLGGVSARKVIILKLLLILHFLFDFSCTSCFLYHFISYH